MNLSRRNVLIGTLAGGGLALGYALRPRRFAVPLPAGENEFAFDAWIKIAHTGVVTVAVPQLEMGQGITTLIPQIVAEELGADWRQIAVESPPPGGAYANGVLAAKWAVMWMPALAVLAKAPDSAIARRWAETARFTATADGASLAAYEQPARIAAASVRAVLAKAAASRWDAAWEECEAKDGFIILGTKRLSFGDLAQDAADYHPPRNPVLRAGASAERSIDFPPGGALRFPRLDLPSKVDGSFRFAADVRLPGMVHAAIHHGPIGETELLDFDEAAAKSVPGVLGVISHKRWLAAVASDWWSAEKALDAMRARFATTHRADTARFEAALDEAVHRGSAVRIHEAGEPDSLAAGPFALARRYDVAPALHAGLETASATARLGNGRLELWLASQAPESARRAVAEALGLGIRDVVLYPMPAGGSFDRRLEHGHAVEAALIARATGRPVQLTWSRWQEHLAGWPRTPVVAVMAAKVTKGGELSGWKARLALPASAREFGRRLLGNDSPRQAIRASANEGDALAMEGATPPYAVPNMVIEHVSTTIALPTGRLRGNAHGYTAFFTESFIDELAHQGGHEPLSYRIALLGDDLRLAQCLQRVAGLATWGGGGDGSGQGLACHRIGEGDSAGRIAVIATARRDERGVRVDKIAAVADIGRIVNVDIARQQIEGGLVFGIGLALGCSTPYAQGLPQVGRLAALGLPVLADCPEIEVEFIESSAPPADPGELGVAVAAPALANALFSATGLRFRRLPLLAEDS